MSLVSPLPVCFKLISSKTLSSLPEHGEPEIRRCALDSTLMSLMYLGVERGDGNFLSTLLDPPSAGQLRAAIDSLEMVGAVEQVSGSTKENKVVALTPLGMHLAGIPSPPTVAKMIVMGALLGCRDAGLVIAAGMTVARSPFLKIMLDRRYRRDDEEEPAEEVKKKEVLVEREKLAKTVGHSDHALLAAAYDMWSKAEGAAAKRKVCDSVGLAQDGMREFKQLRDQLDSALSHAGFTSRAPGCNANGDKWRVVRAVVISALSPGGLVRVERSSIKYDETSGGAVEREGDAKELKFFLRATPDNGIVDSGAEFRAPQSYHGVPQQRVFIHPSSMNHSTGNYSCPWLVNHSIVTTSKPFLRDVCEATGFGLLLFGGSLEVKPSEELLVVGGWARMAAPPRIGVLVGGLRKKMDELLMEKVKNVDFDLSAGSVMKLVVKLVQGEGL